MLHNIKEKLRGSQLFKDSFWSLTGNVIGKGLALVAGIVVARFLGKDVFGEYGIIRNTILTIGVFSTFGLGYTATKYVAEYRRYKPELIRVFIKTANKITLWFSGSMALMLFVFAPYVATQWLDAVHLAIPLRILSVLIIFNAITTTQIGVLSGFGRFKAIAQINSIVGVLTFLLSVLLTWLYDLNGALSALLIVQVVNCALNYFVVRKETAHLELKSNDRKLTKEILSFSTPIALQEAVYSLTSWLSYLLLIKFASYGDLGMYSAAMQWNAIILFIPGILRNVVLSHLSSNTENEVHHNIILKQTIKINFISTVIPSIIITIASPWIAKLYGDNFNNLAGLISFAVFSTVFTSVSNVYTQAYLSKNKLWEMNIMRFIRDFGILILFYVLAKFTSINGVWLLIFSGMIFNVIFLILMSSIYRKI